MAGKFYNLPAMFSAILALSFLVYCIYCNKEETYLQVFIIMLFH